MCSEPAGAGVLGQRYRASVKGEGGFEKDFALLLVDPAITAEATRRARFVRAATRWAQLVHTHVTQAHELDADGAQHYLVSDWIRGASVAELLQGQPDEPPLSAAAALTLAHDVAEALVYAHGRTDLGAHGVPHLGLTPDALIVDDKGVTRVRDVGLLGALAQPGWARDDALAPALGYLAPELARGEAFDPRADVFSVGALVHELLTGRRAFPGPRLGDVLRQLGEAPPPLPGVALHMAPLLVRTLQAPVEARLPSVETLRAVLHALRGDQEAAGRGELRALVRHRLDASAETTAPRRRGVTTSPETRRARHPSGADTFEELLAALPPHIDDEAVTSRVPRIEDLALGLIHVDAASDEEPELVVSAGVSPPPEPAPPSPSPSPSREAASEPSPEPSIDITIGDDEDEDTIDRPTRPRAATAEEPAPPTVPPLELPRTSPLLALKRVTRIAWAIVLAALVAAGGGAWALHRLRHARLRQPPPVLALPVATPIAELPVPMAPAVEPPRPAPRPTKPPAQTRPPAEAKPPASEELEAPELPDDSERKAEAAPAEGEPARAPTRRLMLQSEPNGARAYVDGEDRGLTPMTMTLGAGEHDLVLLAEGYRVARTAIVTQAAAQLTKLVPVRLPEALLGSAGLLVRCATEGELRIFVDGVDTGHTCPNEEALNLAPGTHHVTLYSPRRDQTVEVKRTFELRANAVLRVNLKY